MDNNRVHSASFDMQSKCNCELREFLKSNDVLGNKNLRGIVLDYLGDEYGLYKQLRMRIYKGSPLYQHSFRAFSLSLYGDSRVGMSLRNGDTYEFPLFNTAAGYTQRLFIAPHDNSKSHTLVSASKFTMLIATRVKDYKHVVTAYVNKKMLLEKIGR